MDSTSPLPPEPAEQKCPNCGTMAPLDFALCPRCGMTLSGPSKTIYGCAVLLFQIFLGLLALIFGASGLCLTLLGMPSELGVLMSGALLFALAYFCIRGIISVQKSRK